MAKTLQCGSINIYRVNLKWNCCKLKIDEGWRHGFLGEALIAVFGFFFKETNTVYIRVDGKVYHKELLECGMRPQIRGETEKGYRIYKDEFENGACDKAF